jgi:hypothetical protein
MAERQGAAWLEELGSREGVRRFLSDPIVDTDERGRVAKVDPRPEHRNRASEFDCCCREARQPGADHVGDPRWMNHLDSFGVLRFRAKSVLLKREHELAKEEGVPLGRRVAGAGECLSDMRVVARIEQLRDRPRTQRLEVDDLTGRLSADRRDRARVIGGLTGAPSEHEHCREVADPMGEVEKEAKRRRVGPVDVVDCKEQRLAVGEVRAKPEQPVKSG